MRPVQPGTRHSWELMPDESHTAAALGNEGVEVVASPFLIAFLEQACHLVIDPYYEGDEATVGVVFDMKHVGAARIGVPLLCTAELLERRSRRFTFAVEAIQDGRTIMKGRHGRHLIDMTRFRDRPAPPPGGSPPAPATPELIFWFDVHSPWCYLAALRIGDLARRHETPLIWRPIHLPTMVERINGRRPLDENAAFVAWFQQDLMDWAETMGVPLRYHPDFPLRNSRALRAAAYATDQGRAEAFVQRMMRGYWAEAADITDPAVLASWAAETGLDPEATASAATDPAYKTRVHENTEAAIVRGVFGVPTVGVDDRLFFGNDRLDFLDRFLSRQRTGPE